MDPKAFCAIASFFVVAIPSLANSYRQIMTDPHSQYCQIELLLNYKGGFIRRGLFGQILSYFTEYVDATKIVPIIIILLFSLFAYSSIKWLMLQLDIDLVFLYIFTPTLLSFWIKIFQ